MGLDYLAGIEHLTVPIKREEEDCAKFDEGVEDASPVHLEP